MIDRNAEINPLDQYFSDYIVKIDDALNNELNRYSYTELYGHLRYACEGGKRIRPLILLLSKESVLSKEKYNDDETSALLASCAIELLHTESVIHDDIIDEENMRRGKPSFHIRYGYNSSILTGDFVLGIILNLCSRINNPHVSRELSKAATSMSEGEMMEIKSGVELHIDIDQYIRVIENKTASLFKAAAKIGAILAEGNEEEISALSLYGNFLGIAYQIHDDIIDRNNEDKLFNLLFRLNKENPTFIKDMEDLYKSFTLKAKEELDKLVGDNVPKRHLERLTNLASVQF